MHYDRNRNFISCQLSDLLCWSLSVISLHCNCNMLYVGYGYLNYAKFHFIDFSNLLPPSSPRLEPFCHCRKGTLS